MCVCVCAVNALFLFYRPIHTPDDPKKNTPTSSRKSPRTQILIHLDFGGDLGLGVCDLDANLLGAGDDVDSLSG